LRYFRSSKARTTGVRTARQLDLSTNGLSHFPGRVENGSVTIPSCLIHRGHPRLLNAYQEALLSIEQLRERIPALRQREQTLRAELQAIADQANDQVAFLRLAETLTAFLGRLRNSAETLSVGERQRIVRLVVKDVLVGDDSITIRHSISLPTGPPQNNAPPPNPPDAQSYLLRKGSD